MHIILALLTYNLQHSGYTLSEICNFICFSYSLKFQVQFVNHKIDHEAKNLQMFLNQ
jgi:hypothetical protein